MSYPWLQNLGWAAGTPVVSRHPGRFRAIHILRAGRAETAVERAGGAALAIERAGRADANTERAGRINSSIERAGRVDDLRVLPGGES